MAERAQLERDLGFVRRALERSEKTASPASIYFLWAVLAVIGFSLADFAPERVGLYWSIAGPGGWAISAILGRRFSLRSGQVDKALGLRYGLHWGGMLAAIVLAVMLQARGVVSHESTGQVILLIVTLTYFLAGVHFDRSLLWLSLLLAAGFVALLFVSGPVWTVTGVALAAGLVATPFLQDRRRDRGPR